ncbi:MAG: PorV/PorQ family protein, partial [Gemmatimonadales bacterium]|jgi:hypothetical protein
VVTNNTAYGTTSAEFLLIPATARGSALGSSYAALSNDLGSMYYNPAGLALMDRPGVMASTMTYLAGTKYAYGAFGVPFGGGSRAVGFAVTTFGFSDQPVYTVDDPQGTSGQVYSVRETAVSGTYSQQFSDRFSAGLSVKFINDQLGEVSGQAFAVDFGTNFHSTLAGRAIRAAFVISNLGTNLRHSGSPLDVLYQRQPPAGQDQVPQEDAKADLQTKDWSLPVTFRVALAYDAFATSLSRLTVLGEFNQPNNSQPGFSFGGEYNIALGQSGFSLAGRLGMTYAADDNMKAPGATDAGYAGFDTTEKNQQYRISAGGGLRYAKSGFGIGFDYAYRSYGLLGGVNMLGVSLNW